jgi:leucyl/phenylalanyl-tRNA---protein transferase
MPVFLLQKELSFPNPEFAEEDGMLAMGGDLSRERLLLAYKMGIFPWPFGEDYPITWASPNPRMIMYPGQLKISKSLRKTIREEKFEMRTDTCFSQVIRHCASIPRDNQAGTWITRDIQNAYIDLHEHGYAHSFETFYRGRLVGGLYGVSLGRAFFGESMFHLMPDASKVALYYLAVIAENNHFHFIDCQTPTPHLKRLGGIEVERKKFLELLDKALTYKTIQGKWASRGLG